MKKNMMKFAVCSSFWGNMIIKYWLGFWKNLGFSLPSSHFLARTMVSVFDVSNQKGTFIELGAGRGQITSELLKKLPKEASLHIFEINHDDIELLKKNFSSDKRVHFYEQSAAHLDILFPEGGIDGIISTLPLGSISLSWVDHILSSAHKVLKTWGQFIQYQYWMVNKNDVKRYFLFERIILELRNFGPAFIYKTRKR